MIIDFFSQKWINRGTKDNQDIILIHCTVHFWGEKIKCIFSLVFVAWNFYYLLFKAFFCSLFIEFFDFAWVEYSVVCMVKNVDCNFTIKVCTCWCFSVTVNDYSDTCYVCRELLQTSQLIYYKTQLAWISICNKNTKLRHCTCREGESARMPTVILLDVSLSMSRGVDAVSPCQEEEDTERQILRKDLAAHGCNILLDHFIQHCKLEFASLVSVILMSAL